MENPSQEHFPETSSRKCSQVQAKEPDAAKSVVPPLSYEGDGARGNSRFHIGPVPGVAG